MPTATTTARLRELFGRALATALPAGRSHAAPSGSEAGQGMVEYALILLLIAVVVIVVLTIVGGNTAHVFSNVSSGLGT